MPHRPLARSHRARAAAVFGTFVAACLVAGCDLPGGTTGNGPQPIYAVIYGHVTAPAGRSQVTIEGRAYTDSVDALGYASTGSGFDGGFSIVADASTNNYNSAIVTGSSGPLWLTVSALGQTASGLVYSTDTARAVRFRFDSIGGGPHDSIAVNLNLP